MNFEQVDKGRKDGFTFERTMLFTDFQNVEQLIDTGPEEGIRLMSVHILTPSNANGTNSWKMDRLGAVWIGKEPASEYLSINIFETISGDRYTDSFGKVTAEEMEIKSLKFKFADLSKRQDAVTT